MTRPGADFRVRTSWGDVEIELAPAAAINAATREASLRELRRLLYDFRQREPRVRRLLLEVVARLRGFPSPSADAVEGELLFAARAGSLLLRRRERRSVIEPLEGGEEEVLGPEPPRPEQTWVSIRLFDADGEPVAGAPYEITLENGEVRTGQLDANGWARVADIDGSTCTVVFPAHQGAAA